MKERKKCFHKIVSLVLAAVMMVSVFAVSAPQEVEAAGLSFKGTGTSKVAIKDIDCYGATSKANYIKFTSKVNGYITIKITNNSNYEDPYGYITFCGGKKKALGVTREYFDTLGSKSYSYTRTYGVKKGATYYFKVESSAGVKINATVKSVKKNAGTKKSNAKTLSKGKTVNGYIVAGSKAADWYKIKLTKKQQLKLIYTAKTNGTLVSGNYVYYNKNGIKISLYKSNGKPFTNDSILVSLANSSNTATYYREDYYGKKYGLDTGTYYIKVERYNNTSSGFYTLKWK